jgi:hypothetical protein
MDTFNFNKLLRMKNTAILFLFAIIAFTACDKVKPPYGQPKDVTPVDSGGVTDSIRPRKVLVEDYTGHKCGNCPIAARVLDSIMHRNEGKVIPIAIHAGDFAKPYSGNYTYDFRTPESTALDLFFGISNAGNPNGMVNRSGYPAQAHIIPYTSWNDSVTAMLARPAEASFKILIGYNASTRNITCTTDVEILKDRSDTLKLCVFLTEDSIIQYQTDYTLPSGQQDVANYVHMHALRGSLNTTYGEQLNTGALTKDQILSRTYSYTIPASYNDRHCNIVTFVYNARTYQVIQADMKRVIE